MRTTSTRAGEKLSRCNSAGTGLSKATSSVTRATAGTGRQARAATPRRASSARARSVILAVAPAARIRALLRPQARCVGQRSRVGVTFRRRARAPPERVQPTSPFPTAGAAGKAVWHVRVACAHPLTVSIPDLRFFVFFLTILT